MEISRKPPTGKGPAETFTGEEHWHGASPGHFMTHLSITEGGPHWGPHVTDAEYHG